MASSLCSQYVIPKGTESILLHLKVTTSNEIIIEKAEWLSGVNSEKGMKLLTMEEFQALDMSSAVQITLVRDNVYTLAPAEKTRYKSR